MYELDAPFDRYHVSGVHVTGAMAVMRDPMSLYLAWRDLTNLDRIIERLESVEEISSTRSKWTVLGPANSRYTWEADLITDEPGRRLSWKTVGDPDVASAGTILFRELPADRGTLVRVSLEYAPPGGTVGDVVARWFGSDPAMFIRGALHKFRQVMETGEVAISKGQPVGKNMLRSDRPFDSDARSSDAFVRDIAFGKETT